MPCSSNVVVRACSLVHGRVLIWADLDDGEPATADLTALMQDMPVSCRENTFTEFIDQIVVDRRALPWVDRSSFRQVTYRQADKAVWGKISDHCPVLVESCTGPEAVPPSGPAARTGLPIRASQES